MTDGMEIVGACTNNLKSIDIVLPLRKATMVVGVSGSGKSSLLADTLATEANSRTRRFLGVGQPHLGDEDVPAFLGPLPPSVHFAQSAFRASRRTTLGTSTGLLALLRRYFSRYSTPWSEEVRKVVPPPSPSSYAAWIEHHYVDSLVVWAVVERWQRCDGTRAVAGLQKHGIEAAMLYSETDPPSRRGLGREIDLKKFRPLAATVRHLIEAEVGRVQVSGKCTELTALLERAFDIGGDVVVEFNKGKHLPEQLQTERGTQLDSALHRVHPEVLEPFFVPSDALLSFNSPSNPRSGACKSCNGLGRGRTVLENALVTSPERSMHDGCLVLWTEKNYRNVNIQHQTIEGLRGVGGFSPDIPWRQLGPEARQIVLFGSGDEAVADVDRRTQRKISTPRRFPGFIPEILRRAQGKGSASRLANLIVEGRCPECGGTRWSREARALRLGQWRIQEILDLPFGELRELARPGGPMDKKLPKPSRSLASALHVAAAAFVDAGLGHLSGERGMTTLSEGESRRSRLAALLRTRGEGLALLLDEPARGLHEEDLTRLSDALANLKRRHTLVISEHRASLVKVVDQLLEIGPAGGESGGQIIYQGPPNQRVRETSRRASARARLPVNPKDDRLTIRGARIHTLSNVTCSIPLGRLVSVTGVSGSGKSSFIRGIVAPALARELPGCVDCEGFAWAEGSWDSVEGSSRISSVLALEPRSPSMQRRSTVATLLGLADDLRKIFGRSPEAARLNLKPTDFGWNAGRGRCQSCLGLGEIDDDGGWVACPHCGGRRFGEEVLNVRLNGHNVADILALPMTELLDHSLAGEAGWRPLLEQLVALDLGYLTLGRRLDRVSGGEHQRLRIAQTLATRNPEGLMLVLDEPSAGLHPKDVARLLRVLDGVVGEGANTVLLVEHNLDLIRASDWIIDFGPGGGPEGGRVVGQAPPERIAKLKTPTGRAMRGKQKRPPTSATALVRTMSESEETDPKTVARSARQWFRRLIGEDVPAEELDPVDLDGLAVIFDSAAVVARPHEIGGLDIEIGRLLLDRGDDGSAELAGLAERWASKPNAHLQIHPLLEEIRVWGSRLPVSVTRTAQDRLRHMGLESSLDTLDRQGPTTVRATGERFHLPGGTLGERIQCIRHALAIGGGYVELSDDRQHVLGTIRTRHVDLESPIPAVAPLFTSSASLSRSHAAGRCPSCGGSGSVQTVDEKLFVAQPAADPLDEIFLRTEALGVLKGVRRNILLPFFKRMTSEGLWAQSRPFSQLKPDERTILLHGYWSRPGHGSFLKNPKARPEDVRSWLRWDGFVPAVRGEAGRSRNVEWQKQLETSSKSVDCPRCQGTGLQLHSRAISLGLRSLFDWVREGAIREFTQALRKMRPPGSRAKHMRDRVVHCLEPLSRAVPQAPLREPINDPKLLRSVFERTVHSMTRLKVVD